jgi:hypothetical protein
MSIYAVHSIHEPAEHQIATNHGWGNFCRLVESLPGKLELAHLCDEGESQDTDALERELANLKYPTANLEKVGRALLALAGGWDEIYITDGVMVEP